jgi:copper chaperone CopZ
MSKDSGEVKIMSDQQTRFIVSGMKCEGCVATVKEALTQVVGYEDAEVNLADGVAAVKGDIDPQAVCQVLAQAGYPAVVQSG